MSAVIGGNDNNFNLIRVAAALAVLVCHSFFIGTGNLNKMPLRLTHGLTLGSSSVDVFFVVSGLLVTRSIVNRDSAFEYVKARLLRIWPGLIVCVLLVAYTLGGAVTNDPLRDYLLSARTLDYVINSAATRYADSYVLPGVFTDNPAGASVNAPLWTLAVEVRMYAYLLAAWLVTRLALRWRRRALTAVIGLALAYYAARHFAAYQGGIEASTFRMPFMFFSGATAFLFASRVTLSWRVAAAALSLLLFSAFFPGPLFFVVYSVTLWYLVLWLAFTQLGPIGLYNKVGDYSYGLYIYAWPVQQAIIFAMPGLSVFGHSVLSICATLALAFASWHLVEKPAMRLKRTQLSAALPKPKW